MCTWTEHLAGTRVLKTRVPAHFTIFPFFLLLRCSTCSPDPNLLLPQIQFWSSSMFYIICVLHLQIFFFKSCFLHLQIFLFWSRSCFASLLLLFSFSIFKSASMKLESLQLEFHVAKLLHGSSRIRVLKRRFLSSISSFKNSRC